MRVHERQSRILAAGPYTRHSSVGIYDVGETTHYVYQGDTCRVGDSTRGITFYRGQIRRGGQVIGGYVSYRTHRVKDGYRYRAYFARDGSTDQHTWMHLDVRRLRDVIAYID